jgi:hypothetical protein
MAVEPMFLKGNEIRVGDILCRKDGNRMIELFTVTEIATSPSSSGTYLHIRGNGNDMAFGPQSAAERMWVLRA